MVRATTIDCRGRQLVLGARTLIMGILNVTPDSFSDGGQHTTLEQAVKRAVDMVAEGADIIDVGGESTRPGSLPIGEDEEIRRVIPVIAAIAREVSVPISVDTYKPAVARMALEAGAHIVNDIWGLQRYPEMAQIVASSGAPVVVMHNAHEPTYENVVDDVISFLSRSVDIAQSVGIPSDSIIVDPGIGFGKTWEHNLELLANLDKLNALDKPILLGASRKSFIGKLTDAPPDDRLEGTLALSVLGASMGVDIVRVHDIKGNWRALRVTDAVLTTRRKG